MGGRGSSSSNSKARAGRYFTISDKQTDYYARVQEGINSKGEKGIMVQNYDRNGNTLGNPEFTKSNTTLEQYRARASQNASQSTEVSKITGKSLNNNKREQETQRRLENFRKQGVEIRNTIPKGYVKEEGATTAPNGYTWYSNNKSRFSGQRKLVLVKDK